MSKYKFELSVVLEGQNPDEVTQHLLALLNQAELVIKSVTLAEVQPAFQPAAISPEVRIISQPEARIKEEPFVTYRVADEKFQVFARDFGIQGTELKVPKQRDFLVFRVKAFLEELGYKVEPRTNIRVVSESHTEQVPSDAEESNQTGVWPGTIIAKK